METARIDYKGIARNKSQQGIENGMCDQLLNARFREGKWKPVGVPTKLYDMYMNGAASLISGWVHEMDSQTKYIAQDENFKLIILEPTLNTTVEVKQYDGPVHVEFLKRFMIVVFDGGMDRFSWKPIPIEENSSGGEYTVLNYYNRPIFSAYTSYEEVFESDIYTKNIPSLVGTPEGIRGNYYKLLNDKSKDGFFTGALFVRVAFRLFDGSYVLHSLPRVVSVNDLGLAVWTNGVASKQLYRAEATFAKLNVLIPSELYADYEDLKDIVSNIVVFASKAETVIDWSESIDDDVFDMIWGHIDSVKTWYINDYVSSVNKYFKELYDSASWYKVGEYPLVKVLEGDINEEIDLKDFYQDYSTRETMPVDNFTHHKLSANVTYNYNSRLIIGDVKTKFGDYKYFPLEPILDGSEFPNLMPAGYVQTIDKVIRFLITLDTDNGEIKKLGEAFTVPAYLKTGDITSSTFIPIALGQLGYPDIRAKKIEVLVQGFGGYYNVGSYSLKKSKYDNFAYYIDPDFNTSRTDHKTGIANYPLIIHQINPASMLPVNTDAYPETEYRDTNRVQISEVNNPFFFAAENSYQVGTGIVTGVATNTEPLSTGQFGEYPLQVFTNKGVYAMLQGQGSVLFSNIVPVSGEVADPNSILSLGSGVLFKSNRGLHVLVGSQATLISDTISGKPNTALLSTANFQLRLNHLTLIRALDSIAEVDFMVYLDGAVYGFDKINNELLISNSNYSYSYIFNFEAKIWYMIDKSYKLLINYYPRLLCLSENILNPGIFDKSNELFDGTVNVVFCVRPVKLNISGNYALIHRAIQRCEIETKTSTFAGFYVFGSNDLKRWQLFQGTDKKTGVITDLFCTRSHLKCKYFVFLFAAELKADSSINEIDLQYYFKLMQKIR